MNNLIIHSKFTSHSSAISKAINDFDTAGITVLKGDRNTIKSLKIDGLHLNIKQFKTPNIFNAFVYKYIRKSKARRSYEYGNILTQKLILTPTPIAYFEASSWFGLKQSYYVSQQVNYDFDFRVLIHDLKFPNRVEILKQFTAFTFKLHEENVNFLDHSPGNTLIVKTNAAQYDFYLIDLNRMRFETMNIKKRMHNFRRLWLSKTMIHIMAKEYSELSETPLTEIQSGMLHYSRQFQKKIDAKKLKRSGRKMVFKTTD
ncbi:lipopolysaccharide kinase InaA family protein [Flavobacteriaceae bacterium]|nr:lipopolysaccharide kinase InaA family protein [Flavobacteriaceae bacterium]